MERKISRHIVDEKGNKWSINLRKHDKYSNRFLSYFEINGTEFDIVWYYSIKSARSFWKHVRSIFKETGLDDDFESLIDQRKRKRKDDASKIYHIARADEAS